jgi:predicted ATP-dependent protease
LRQDIAVTGSINQWGEIQPIGAVNEKIEGFFDVCREAGLTGQQGVCIPNTNVKNLVLRQDVIEAVDQKQFHIWAINHINQGIGLLSDLPAGDIHDSDSFHGTVDKRIREMDERLKPHATSPSIREMILAPGMPGAPRDPRPPLPGRSNHDL